jgi:hypothetical protein
MSIMSIESVEVAEDLELDKNLVKSQDQVVAEYT